MTAKTTKGEGLSLLMKIRFNNHFTVRLIAWAVMTIASLVFVPVTVHAAVQMSLPVPIAMPPKIISEFIHSYCLDCHDSETKKGDLDFNALAYSVDRASQTKWIRVFDRVTAGEMPPEKKPRPPEHQRIAVLETLEKDLTQQHQAVKGTVLRRLNRMEYQNTLRDLFGLPLDVMDILPADDLAHGFDTVGEALGLSEVHLRRYLDAVELAINAVPLAANKPVSSHATYSYADTRSAKQLFQTWWLKRSDGSVVLFNNGGFPSSVLDNVRIEVAGPYRLRITAYAYQSDAPLSFSVYTGNFGRSIDADLQGYFSVDKKPTIIELKAWLRAGDSLKISPLGLNPDKSLRTVGVDKYKGRGLGIVEVAVEGPLFETWPLAGQRLLFGDLPIEQPIKNKGAKTAALPVVVSKDPLSDGVKQIRLLARAAFRRPITDSQVAPYVALFNNELKAGSSFQESMHTAASAILCSPDFLFLKEGTAKPGPQPLDDYAIASRLSYFLIRTMPDAELLQEAAAGRLHNSTVLRAQTDRLLNHPNHQRFIADFIDGWLDLRSINFTTPDALLYPEFDDQLRDSMVMETRGFIDELIVSNLPLSHLVKSDFALLNDRLAAHYGIAGVVGSQMQKIILPPNSQRGGLLTQASVLKVSANGTNTSPVIRGVYMMERILGFKASPPPAGIASVEPDIRGATTIREQLQKHRTLESCNGCHRILDPPGFALESYDVTGGFRDHYRSLGAVETANKGMNRHKIRYKIGPPVDASGEYVGAGSFKSFSEFQSLLLNDQDRITANVAERLLTFASGREMGFSDRSTIAAMVQHLKKQKGGMRDLVFEVVQSDIFLNK